MDDLPALSAPTEGGTCASGPALVGFVVIAVIGWVAALAINQVVRADREPRVFKVILIAAIDVAAAVGVATMFYVVPAFWD
jgi:hypothetical protein